MQYYQEQIALGSKTGLSIVSTAESSQVGLLYNELWRSIFMFERQFSRFLPGSELSMLNRNAGAKQVISSEFREILLAASRLAQETGGLYNPFILPALQASGYSHSRVPGHEQDAVDDHSKKAVTSIDKLEVGDDWARIPYGTAIDLGGCGKGYLADQLRSQLPEIVTGYWLSFGGDIVVGGNDEQGQAWTVNIEAADDPGKNIGTIMSSSACGVATSGTTVHKGKKARKSWHHIIDPRTRQPAETDVLLATVCHDSALYADVLASCAVILGSQQGIPFLKQHAVKSAVLQCQSRDGTTRTMHFGNAIINDNHHA